MSTSDTIAALSSAPGISAVAVIRVSGPKSKQVWNRFLRTTPGSKNIPEIKPRAMTRAFWLSDSKALDELLACFFSAPGSYTGEELLEIHAHGGVANVDLILENILSIKDIRLAERGEFTLRAMLNGKMSLPQAEAVLDIIHAPGPEALNNAVLLRGGALLKQIEPVRKKLVEILAGIEVVFDYPEDGLEPSDPVLISDALKPLENRLQSLLEGFRIGHACQNGFQVVIAGKPNVGKSSILNRILGHERVLVDPEPGTTRDAVSETVIIHGLPFRFFDTAGIRFSAKGLEARGVEIAETLLTQADIVVFVLDNSVSLDKEDSRVWEKVRGRPHLIVKNKIDLKPAWSNLKSLEGTKNEKINDLSALKGNGFEELYQILTDYFKNMMSKNNAECYITNIRHREAIKRALKNIDNAQKAIVSNLALDAAATELHCAIREFAAIEGLDLRDEVLKTIFDRFCVGK